MNIEQAIDSIDDIEIALEALCKESGDIGYYQLRTAIALLAKSRRVLTRMDDDLPDEDTLRRDTNERVRDMRRELV